jgi:hypothetical protein
MAQHRLVRDEVGRSSRVTRRRVRKADDVAQPTPAPGIDIVVDPELVIDTIQFGSFRPADLIGFFHDVEPASDDDASASKL